MAQKECCDGAFGKNGDRHVGQSLHLSRYRAGARRRWRQKSPAEAGCEINSRPRVFSARACVITRPGRRRAQLYVPSWRDASENVRTHTFGTFSFTRPLIFAAERTEHRCVRRQNALRWRREGERRKGKSHFASEKAKKDGEENVACDLLDLNAAGFTHFQIFTGAPFL